MTSYSNVVNDAPWTIPLAGALLAGCLGQMDGRSFVPGFLLALCLGFGLYGLTGCPMTGAMIGVAVSYLALFLYNVWEDRPGRRGAKPPRRVDMSNLHDPDMRRGALRPPWSPFNR